MPNQTWIVRRASGGQYQPDCFALSDRAIAEPEQGQLVIDSLFLSLDPTHLNWVKLDPRLQFIPIRQGDPMLGTGIGLVRQSKSELFRAGDVVMGTWSWSRRAVTHAHLVQHARPESEMSYPDQLTILSHVGQAAARGLVVAADTAPGDSVLVSGAAGATGSIAAQLAKAMGCRTIGIAGGAAKCSYLLDDLHLDGAIDYRSENVEDAIGRHFPLGIDVFFDNVGGATLDAALPHMAIGGRIAMCGAIAQYDMDQRNGTSGIRNLPMLIFRQARIAGFVAADTDGQASRFDAMLREHAREGKIRVKTHIVPFEDMPKSLSLLLSGQNDGKLIAQCARMTPAPLS